MLIKGINELKLHFPQLTEIIRGQVTEALKDQKFNKAVDLAAEKEFYGAPIRSQPSPQNEATAASNQD